MLNIENIQKVIDKLSQEDVADHFSLDHFFAVIDQGDVFEVSLSRFLRETYDDYYVEERGGYECDTVACIAGWTLIVKSEQEDPDLGFPSSWKDTLYRHSDFTNLASEFLGIEDEVGKKLFFAKTGSYWHQYADELGLDVNELEYGDWDKIRPRHAIILLHKLMNGELEKEVVG